MKVLKSLGHQGDTQWHQISEIPTTAKKVQKKFIAESERSGSFHGLFGNYDMYETSDGDILIDVKEECTLNHSLKREIENINMDYPVELPKKDHRMSVIPQGKYLVTIQQRFDPLTAHWVNTKD